MYRSFFWNRRYAGWAYGVLSIILLCIFINVQISVKINDWYGTFYDMLGKATEHNISEFWLSIGLFLSIAMPAVLLIMFKNYCMRRYAFAWRQAITGNYISLWRNVKNEIEGASQRIQEDAYRFTKIIESLASQGTTALMTLTAFLPVLWVLSKKVNPDPFILEATLRMNMISSEFSSWYGDTVGLAISQNNLRMLLLCSLVLLPYVVTFGTTQYEKYRQSSSKVKGISGTDQLMINDPPKAMCVVALIPFLPAVLPPMVYGLTAVILFLMKYIDIILTPVVLYIADHLIPYSSIVDHYHPDRAEIIFFFGWWGLIKTLAGFGIARLIIHALECGNVIKNSTVRRVVRAGKIFCAPIAVFALWHISMDTLDFADQFSEYGIHSVPGLLVWVALATSLGGMIITWFVGYFLPGLEYNNQRCEAAFRKELVLGEDDKEGHALVPTLLELFTGIRLNYNRLFLHYGYFDLWVNWYGQIMVIVPYVAMAPSLFSGMITLGLLTQTGNAFDKVHGSFSILIDNWTTITELRSIHMRLKEFEANLERHQITSA